MRTIILLSFLGGAFGLLKTVDVSSVVDIDLTLYKLTYEKDKGQSLRDFPEKDGFSASEVDMRGLETAERIGQAYIAVDGPIYRLAYSLLIPNLEFHFGKLHLPDVGDFKGAIVSAKDSKMDRILEYTPLKNGKCLMSDGILWTELGNGQLQEEGKQPLDVSAFINSTFREALNARSGLFNLEYDERRCREFTTPFSTVFV